MAIAQKNFSGFQKEKVLGEWIGVLNQRSKKEALKERTSQGSSGGGGLTHTFGM